MSTHQDIYNEILDPSSVIISTKYYVEPDINSKWNHRPIEYNAAGIPILRLYEGETKTIYKKVFVNGVERNIELIKDNTPFEYFGTNDENRDIKIISGNSTGNYVQISGHHNSFVSISNTITGNLPNEYKIVNNPELLVIVEKEPKIINLKWGHENPLILDTLDDVKLSLKTIHVNGQECEVDSAIMNQLQFMISNPHALIILNDDNQNLIKPRNFDEKCQIKIKDSSMLEIFGENILNIEPLSVIIYKDIQFESLLNSKFIIQYKENLPLLNVNDTYTITIQNVYELPDNEIITHDVSYLYEFTSNAENITINRNTIQAHDIGIAQITAKYKEEHDEFVVFPKEIIWNANVIKNITNVNWFVNKTQINIYDDEAIISVIVNYDDGTSEDISNNCSFKYDSKYINVQGNKIIPVSPGRTDLMILSSNNIDDLIPNDSISITIIQPITKMTLNKSSLDLKIGTTEQLEFSYEPYNATPMELEWLSTDPDVVSVDSKGVVKALARGNSTIIVTTRNEETNEENIDENDKFNKYTGNNIYLPRDLIIDATTNDLGIAEIKLLDSSLYTIKLYDIKHEAISNTKLTYYNDTEQVLEIFIRTNELITYDNTLYAEVTNFYGELVYTMPVIVYLENERGERIDVIATSTNKLGIAVIQSLNKTFTNDDGLAIIDDMRVNVKYTDENINNVEVIHKEKRKLTIITPELDIDVMKRLVITVTNDDSDENFIKGLNDIEVKIYNNDVLIYNDYANDEGIIELNSSNKIDDADDTIDDDFPEIEDITTNLLEYNPTQCAICKVESIAIDVVSIKFKQSTYTLDIDDNVVDLDVIITPENATFTDCKFIVEDINVARITNNNELYGYNEGLTAIKAILIDNPEIYDEAEVMITNHRVKSVTIDGGNDIDYEWYDHLNQKRYYLSNGEFIVAGDRVTEEKYDDDDFSRFYLPVNNSLQLTASISPSNSNNNEIKWLSSDSNLVKVNDKGIITAIRQGKQELDVYGDDDVSETRFANTVWITAINPRYKKYAVCQVRVTRNKIVGINIPTPNEHDYDEDDILPNGIYDENAEHEFDYVMNIGETIKIPVNLSVQDSSFGTSDSIEWCPADMDDIIEISNGKPKHSNAKDDDFDWTTTTPETVNRNKNSFELEVKAIGIGDTYIFAKTRDNCRGINDRQLYVPNETSVIEIPESGTANIDSKHGIKSITVKWFSEKSKILTTFKRNLAKLMFNIEVSDDLYIDNVIENHSDLFDTIIDDEYIAKNGLPVSGAKCVISPNGSIKIIVPDKCNVKNLETTNDSTSLPVEFEYNPTIDRPDTFDTSSNNEKAKEYIVVTLTDVNKTKRIIPIYLDAITTNDENLIIRRNFVTNIINNNDNTDDIVAYFPSSENTTNIDNLSPTDIGDALNARPGTGIWINGPKSRQIKIRVVATPKKLNIGWINAYNSELVSMNTINGASVTKRRWGKKEYRYMAIGYDDEFKDLLKEASERNEELAEKYKAFAWFSDNENVIRFEDVEDLNYTDKYGNPTNNPNENYLQIQEKPVVTSFGNISPYQYSGYKYVNEYLSIKFGEKYTESSDGFVKINNTSQCIVKLTAPYDGEFRITHSGSIQYDSNELFNSSPQTLTVNSGYDDSIISVKRYDVFYIKGTSNTIVYIKQIGFYANDESNNDGFTGVTMASITDKTPTEYVKYKDMFYVQLLNDNSRVYSSSKGLTLYKDISSIKFTPKVDATMTITFSKNNITINRNNTSTSIVGKSQSPYTFDIIANNTYVISSDNADDGAIISDIKYANKAETEYTGSFKGGVNFKVKPSYMKRVICEGKGTAKIYVLSPKGKALISKTIHIE